MINIVSEGQTRREISGARFDNNDSVLYASDVFWQSKAYRRVPSFELFISKQPHGLFSASPHHSLERNSDLV